jgi:hypothetical protein
MVVLSKFHQFTINRGLHRFAFSPSNFAKSLIRPIDLHAIMAIIQTTDCRLLEMRLQRRMRGTYLKRQEEEVHVPICAGNAVFIDNCHTDGS